MESCENGQKNEQPLAILHEYLCNEPTVSTLKCFLQSASGLQRIPYLQSLSQRMDATAGSNIQLPTAYDLLRKFKHIDFRKLIIQSDNQEVASFSNARLCVKYARNYQLNFMHYLKQQRSAYAVYYLLTDQLQQYAQLTPTQMFSACEAALEMAIEEGSSADSATLAHCVAFCEYLGFDTQALRCFLKLNRLLPQPQVGNLNALMQAAESQLLQALQQQAESEFPLHDYEALMRLTVQHGSLQWPVLILQHYAARNDWFHLLVLLQYFDIPLRHIRNLLPYFENADVGQNLLRALAYADNLAADGRCKRQSSFNRQQREKKKLDNLVSKANLKWISIKVQPIKKIKI